MEKENNLNKESSEGILKCFRGIFSRERLPVFSYATFLMVLCVFSLIVSTSKVRRSFYGSRFCKSERGMVRCAGIVGYGAVDRACLAHALFHAVLAAMTSELWIFKKWREEIHSEFWGCKVFVLTVSVFLCLWIPTATNFDKMFSYFGFVCGFVFTVIQMLVLLGMINQWLNYLVPDLDILHQQRWRDSRFLFYHSIISILYLFSLLLLIYFFLLFAFHSTCRTNLIFLSYVLTHCLLILVLALLLKFKRKQSEKAIPETLVCTLYVIFTSWLAMCSNTQVLCNPYLQEINQKSPGIDGNAILCLVILSLVVCYIVYDPALVLSRLKNFFLCEFREDSVIPEENPTKKSPTKCKKIHERLEQQSESVHQHSYSYSGLHMFMSLSSFYVITSVTNWYQVDIDGDHVTYRTSMVAMVVLMSTTFVCLWIFTWILVKPVWLGFLKRFCKGDFDKEKTTNNMETGLTGLEPKASGAVHQGPGHDNEGEFKEATDFEARETVEDVISEANNCKAALKLCEVKPLRLSIDREMDKIIEDKNDLERNKKAVDGQVKKEKEVNSKNEREMEMIRLQAKVLRLQDKIGKLQNKVAGLQGVSL